MRTAVFALVALLAVQSASAGWFKKEAKEDSYASKAPAAAADSYEKATVVVEAAPRTRTVTKTVAVEGAPVAVERTEACRPAMVAITAEPTMECGTGFEAKTTEGKMSCTRQVCTKPAPVAVEVEAEPVATEARTVVVEAADEYGAASSKGGKFEKADKWGKADKYGWFKKESKKAYAKKDSADEYVTVAKAAKKVVMVEQAEVCTTVEAAPRKTCAKGTFSGSVCVIGAEAAGCPEGFTAEKSLCTKKTTEMAKGPTTYVQVQEEVEVEAVAADAYGHAEEAKASKWDKFAGKGDKYGWWKKSKSHKSAPAAHKVRVERAESAIPACPSAPKAAAVAAKVEAVVAKVQEAKPAEAKPIAAAVEAMAP